MAYPMKPLAEFNVERLKHYAAINQPHPNGIACPKCGAELWDSDPTRMLASNPPQKNVNCPGCGYVGYRFA